MKTTKEKLIPFIYPVLFIIFALLLELVSKIVLGFSFSGYFLINFAVIMGISSIIFLCRNNIVQIVVSMFFLLIQTVISITNMGLSEAFGDVFSFETLFIMFDGLAAVEASFINFWGLIIFVCLFLMMLFFEIALYGKVLRKINIRSKLIKKQKKIDKVKKYKIEYLASALIIVFSIVFPVGVYFAGLSLIDNQSVAFTDSNMNNNMQINDMFLFENQYFKLAALEKFGFYGFYFKNFTGAVEKSLNQKSNVNDEVKDYILNSPKGEKSEKFGVKEGDNFITILMESVDLQSVHPVLTPNLYAILNNTQIECVETDLSSYVMSNYYVKGKTNICEMGATTGMAPFTSKYTLSYRSVDTDKMAGNFDFSLANMFKNSGYQTNYLINHEIDYYGRENVFNEEVFGFENVYDAKSIPNNQCFEFWGDWKKDSETIEYYKDNIFPADKPFYTQITTMVTHGPYDNKVEGLEGNLAEIAELIESENYENPVAASSLATQKNLQQYLYYQAAIMDFDDAIGIMLNDLEQKGILDKTTIMMYADHEAYYYGLANMKHNLKLNDYTSPERYHIPMYIVSANDENFNPTDDNYVIDKQVVPYDVYATVCDLAGFEYLENLCFGESVFLPKKDGETRVLYSSMGGMFSKDIYTNNGIDLIVKKGYIPTEVEKKSFYVAIHETIYKANMIKEIIERYVYAGIKDEL